MKTNEIGDFLTVVFAPLAFFWLVIGYFQQQKELRQNTKALNLQAEELKNSVEQQTKLVETANKQVQLDKQVFETENLKILKEYHPKITISGGILAQNPQETAYRLNVKNVGSFVSNLHLSISPKLPISKSNYIGNAGENNNISIQ